MFLLKMVLIESLGGEEEDGNLHLSLCNSLRVIERWRSKKEQEEPRAGTLFALKGKVARSGEEERAPPYIENVGGSHNLKIQLG